MFDRPLKYVILDGADCHVIVMARGSFCAETPFTTQRLQPLQQDRTLCKRPTQLLQMIQSEGVSTEWSPAGASPDQDHPVAGTLIGVNKDGRKRPRNDFESAITPPPAKRAALDSCNALVAVQTTLGTDQINPVKQLPSPGATDSSGDHRRPGSPPCASPSSRRPSAYLEPIADVGANKTKPRPEASSPYHKTRAWIEATVASPEQDEQDFVIGEQPRFDLDGALDGQSDMPTLKRQASHESTPQLSSCGDGLDSLASTDARSNFYSSNAFPVLLERHGIYMKDSIKGLDATEQEFCKEMLSSGPPHPKDPLLDETVFPAFCNLLHNKSEQWLVKNMHSHIFPAPELLALEGHDDFKGLIEGCDDAWIRMPCPTWGKRPQPDCTIAFQWDNFSHEDIRKLGIVIGEQSKYTARDDMFFPFITREAKSDKQPLDQAHRQNVYSMAIGLEAILDLFRRLGRLEELNGKVLGFSLSYDNDVVRMYAHHAETSRDCCQHTPLMSKKLITRKYCAMVDEVFLKKDGGKDRWKPYDFFYNVCRMFSTRHLKRIKDALSLLPEASDISFQSVASVEELLQDSPSWETSFKKPRNGTIHAELRKHNEGLLNHLRSQQDHFKRESDTLQKQLKTLEAALSQQRDDSKQQMELQVEQQKQEIEKQRKQVEQQVEQQKQQMEQQRKQMEEQLQEQREFISYLKAQPKV